MRVKLDYRPFRLVQRKSAFEQNKQKNYTKTKYGRSNISVALE